MGRRWPQTPSFRLGRASADLRFQLNAEAKAASERSCDSYGPEWAINRSRIGGGTAVNRLRTLGLRTLQS